MTASEIAQSLTEHFENLTRVEHKKFAVYRVSQDHNLDAGMISYLGQGEWRVYVDNFPSPKKYYQFNLPVRSIEQFKSDIDRTGLKLVTKTK